MSCLFIFIPSWSLQNRVLPPVANTGISQTVNENTKVTHDGTASYAPAGAVVVAYQWTQLTTTGVPVVLTVANTATPTLTTPIIPSYTVFAFSLRVMDNHGDVSTNPAVVYVMVKHITHSVPALPSDSIINQPQEQQQLLPPRNPLHSPQQPLR